MRVLSRLFPFGNFVFRFFQLRLFLLDGALPFFDHLERVLRLQGSFRSGPRGLRRVGFALADPSLAPRQRGLASSEILRSCVQLRHLGLELRFPLIELAGPPRPLAQFVEFGLEA